MMRFLSTSQERKCFRRRRRRRRRRKRKKRLEDTELLLEHLNNLSQRDAIEIYQAPQFSRHCLPFVTISLLKPEST